MSNKFKRRLPVATDQPTETPESSCSNGGKNQENAKPSPRGVGKTYGKLDPMTLIVQLGGLFGGELFR